MPELISLRECGRRLGVSDTAVRKALKSGQITVASRTEKSGRPLVDWETVPGMWARNKQVQNRAHVGSQGSPARAKDAPRVELPKSSNMDRPLAAATEVGAYAKARAAREVYEAKLAQLKYEQQIGKLVEVSVVGKTVEAAFTRVRTRLLAIPNSVAPELIGVTAVTAVRDVLAAYIREALEELVADV